MKNVIKDKQKSGKHKLKAEKTQFRGYKDGVDITP